MASNTSSQITLANLASPIDSARDEGTTTRSPARGSQEEDHGHEFSLPRVDGGKEAWLLLAGSFTIEALLWGKHILSLHPFTDVCMILELISTSNRDAACLIAELVLDICHGDVCQWVRDTALEILIEFLFFFSLFTLINCFPHVAQDSHFLSVFSRNITLPMNPSRARDPELLSLGARQW